MTPDEKLAEIKRLYYRTTRRTVEQDVARAVELLRSMESEEERERARGYMDGLSQMRSDWRPAAAMKPNRAVPKRPNR